MTRAGRDPAKLKTAKGRTASSTKWLTRQLNDPYVKRARDEGYRSRAAFKMAELDERFSLLKGVKAVVDLGIAPGGWSQVVARRSPSAAIVGIDLADHQRFTLVPAIAVCVVMTIVGMIALAFPFVA